jgi:hypothetical protein
VSGRGLTFKLGQCGLPALPCPQQGDRGHLPQPMNDPPGGVPLDVMVHIRIVDADLHR